MTILKHKITINKFKKRIDKYKDIIHILYQPINIKKWIHLQSEGLESGYGEKNVFLIYFTPHFYDRKHLEFEKMEMLEYYKKYKKI
jgi:hypothetical protein